jgi:adenylate kinase
MIVLVGPPCSGKGTQVQFFREMGVEIVSIGHTLRTKYRNDPEIQDLINNGRMVPNTVIHDILRDQVTKEEIYLFDGYPRTLDQARDFLKLFPNDEIKVIVLEVSTEELLRRMRNRSSCELCGAVFSKITNCCGKATVQRKDDQDSFFKRRLEIYNTNCKEIIKILNSKVFYINASQEPKKIFKQIIKEINL